MRKRRLKRARQRRSKEEARGSSEEENEDEVAGEERLVVETEGTEDEGVEIFEAALEMDVKDTGKGEQGGDGTLRALEDLEFLT